MLSLCLVIRRCLRVSPFNAACALPQGYCQRKTREKTTSSVFSVLLLIYGYKIKHT